MFIWTRTIVFDELAEEFLPKKESFLSVSENHRKQKVYQKFPLDA